MITVAVLGAGGAVSACAPSLQVPAASNTLQPAVDERSKEVLEPGGIAVRELVDEIGAPNAVTHTPVALQTYCQIWRFLVPADSVSTSERLWNHLEESTVSVSDALHMRSNGLRIGVGNAATWPAIRSVLQDLDALTWNRAMVVDLGTPLCIEMRDLQAQLPIFSYTRDGGLEGARQAPGRLCLRVDQFMDLRRPGRAKITLMPEIRREKQLYAWDLAKATGPVPRESVQDFVDLAVTITLEPGEYLLIGPSRSIRLTHLIGSVLLKQSMRGLPRRF